MGRAGFWIVLLGGLLAGALYGMLQALRPPLLGQAIGAAVLLFHVVLLLVAWLRSQHELFDAWLFLLPLSLFQVVPDWILVRQLGVLVFPDLGGQRLDAVPLYMAGLWVAPLLVVLWLGEAVHRRSALLAIPVAALAGALVFGAAEWAAVRHGLWLPRGVATWHGIAWYVLAAEAALGLATWLMFVQVQHRALPVKVAGAAVVSVFYAGALAVSLFLFRRFG